MLCAGAVLAALPLPDPATAPNRFTLTAPLSAKTAEADLCLTIAPPVGGPLYGIDTVQLTPKEPR
jgi:hexosaminidase